MFPNHKASVVFFLLLFLRQATSHNNTISFAFNGLHGANLSVDGCASVAHNGLLQLTYSKKGCKGHAFYPSPFRFRSNSSQPIMSFSTSIVFAIVPILSGRITSGTFGMAFVISPTKQMHSSSRPYYLGIFNQSTTNQSSSNHIVAVAFDEVRSANVLILVNSRRQAVESRGAAYFQGEGFRNLSLVSGESMQLFVDYDAEEMKLNVTLLPINMTRSELDKPLMSTTVNLTDVILDDMYVGFSATVGVVPTAHYIRGWSFGINDAAPPLDLSSLPKLPVDKKKPPLLTILLPIVTAAVVAAIIVGAFAVVRRRKQFAEVLEEWELEYGPHRFSYKDLFRATDGFKEKELLGAGGFGKVYRGVLPSSKAEIAVKRISHDSRQGMREFVAEIVSIGRLRHRNLVQLLGYCRRKGELLLVYDFMPNGSLDRLLFNKSDYDNLSWNQRFRIIKGVASGLLYLHEEWEQIVVHRDVKSSNVLLDGELNGRLGDFGLARLYDHGTKPQTTHVVGTIGYIAPELARTGKASTATDVFAFGAFLLEVACARRPIELQATNGDIITSDWVMSNWKRGGLLLSADPRLRGKYPEKEVELVLKLGLLCSHTLENARPSMRQVMQFLDGQFSLPEMSPDYWEDNAAPSRKDDSFNEYFLRSSTSYTYTDTGSSTLFYGR